MLRFCQQAAIPLSLVRRSAFIAAVTLSPLFSLTGCESPGRHSTLGRPLPPLMMTRQADRLPTPPRNPLYEPPQQVARPQAKPAPSWTPRRQPSRMIGPKRIIIDAGHGGKDPGAVGRGPMVEKEVNLAVARLLVEELELRGAEVIQTRPTDRFISLNARANMAERTRADLFISIHSDAARRAGATGSTVYIARNASWASKRVGQAIEDALVRAGVESRGVRPAGFRVLVGHSRPAVLVELGFLTNRQEAYRLAQPDYQDKLAQAIARGITDHFTRR